MNWVLLICAVLVAVGAVFLTRYLEKKKSGGRFAKSKIFFVVLCGLFIVSYFLRLFTTDFFAGVSLVKGSDIFSNSQIVFLTILRFLTQGLVVYYMLAFFRVKSLKTTLATFGLLVTLLNIIFFKWNLLAFEGANFSFSSYRAIEFAIECSLALSISAIMLYEKIKEKDWKKTAKELMFGVLAVLSIALIMMHPYTLQNLFSVGDYEAEGFTFTHRICMYLILCAGLILHFCFRNKDQKLKHFVCLSLSIAGISSFFIIYTWDIPLTALPLHLCNAALIVGLFAMIFKSKKLFYFTYFVNVLGAVLALLMPDTDGSILLDENIRFWVTHISVVLVPLLAVAWEVFPRPNLKMMKNSIIVFTIYFIVACWSNMLISNVEPGVNYFFLQNDFFIKKFPWAFDIRAKFVWEFAIGTFNFKVWPLYWAIIYAVYIVAMFGMWLLYAYLYQVTDRLKKIKELERIDALGLKQFKKEVLQGKKLSEPINKESTELLEIKNFTKIYGNSQVPAVEDFSLTVGAGEVFGFLGHNGAGKSTLIKSIVGVQSITKGSISICGYDIVHQPLEAKLRMGYVSDNHAVYEKLTGRDYINFVADLYLVNKKDRDHRLEKYAKMFNLYKDIDRQIKGYSHGMKQKLVVIASIIHNPKVWILDEPLTGLDPMSAHQIKTLMRDMADQGNIVFFSSHVIEVVEKICDKIAIIAKGKIKGVFNLKDLEENNISLEELYLNIQENPDYEMDEKIKKLSLYKPSSPEVLEEASKEQNEEKNTEIKGEVEKTDKKEKKEKKVKKEKKEKKNKK